jgi:flagellar protein FlaF
MAQTAYSSSAAPIRTARSAEYAAFAKITHQLRSASKTKKTNFPQYVEALNSNRKLWRLLAVDVASPGNQLPDSLRARIISLAEFTRKHTSSILSGDADEVALVEINTTIMRGLSPQGGQS